MIKFVVKANSFNSFHTEAFAVCENYSPPEGFNPKDLYRLLEKVGSPSGGEDLGNVMFYMIASVCMMYWLDMLRIALLLNGLCLELGQFTNGHSLKRKFPKLSSSSPFLDFGWIMASCLMGPILSSYLLVHVEVMILCWITDCSSGWLEGPNKVYIPFLACGDLSGYDSDRSYPLPKVADGTYKSLDPVQPPIAPPYKRALELKKASSHGIQELEKLSLDSWSWCITNSSC